MVNLEAWLLDRPEIESVFACVCDLNGTLRGKRTPVANAARVADGGLRMPLSIMNVDVWGEDVENSALVFETGDSDGICEPTGRAPLTISWTSKPAGLLQFWMAEENGRPFDGDPRRALANVVRRFKERGLTPVVAVEMEFYLVDPAGGRPQAPQSPLSGKRLDSDGVLSLDELQHFDAFLNDVYATCDAQGIPADAVISENGAGQFEINMTHVADALRAADDAVHFKSLIRGIARKHGFAGTFMAKPYGFRAGSGMHVHFSLVDDDGRNVFDDGGAAGTPLMRHAVGGLLRTMQQCALTFAPHENSFRRLRPDAHAPTNVAWGYENRTASIRIPGGNPKARRIEHRVAGADANPYLVLASILGGALLGIERRIAPSEPIVGNAYLKDLPQLPPDWASAIDAFEDGPDVREIFSGRLQKMLIECKKQELRRFSENVTDFEYHSYLEVV